MLWLSKRVPKETLRLCNGCEYVKYHNRECQIDHRPIHKFECKKLGSSAKVRNDLCKSYRQIEQDLIVVEKQLALGLAINDGNGNDDDDKHGNKNDDTGGGIRTRKVAKKKIHTNTIRNID